MHSKPASMSISPSRSSPYEKPLMPSPALLDHAGHLFYASIAIAFLLAFVRRAPASSRGRGVARRVVGPVVYVGAVTLVGFLASLAPATWGPAMAMALVSPLAAR